MGFFHNDFLNDNYKRKILNSCWRWLNFIHFSHLFSQWGHLHCKNVSPPQYSNRNTVLGSNGHRKHICRTSHIQHSSFGFQSRHIQHFSSSAMSQCCRHHLFLAIHSLTELKWLFCWQNKYWVVGIFRVFCFFIRSVRLSWRGGVGMAWRWVKIIMLVVNQGRCSIRISSHVFVNWIYPAFSKSRCQIFRCPDPHIWSS